MPLPSAAELEQLLARAGWVRALAGRLADDRDVADDLVQDAYVAALSAPGGVRAPAGYLAVVARNLARRRRRGEARRAARERDAARPMAVAETLDLVEQAELQARVIQAVTALEEPYRTTVLLRFFEGLSLVEVGEKTGVPASTARTRLARALERLRERFDREHGGDRAAWCAAFLRLAGPEVGAAAGVGAGAGVVAGVLAMNLWMKGAAAAALVAVGIAGWRAMGSGERAAEPLAARDGAPRAAEQAAPEDPRAALAAVPAAERSERAQVAAEEAAPRERPAAGLAVLPAFGVAPARLGARLVDEQGRGIGGGELRARQGNGERDLPSDAAERSAPDGSVVLDVPLPAPWSSAVAVASAPGRATAYATTRLESGTVSHLGELVLGPGCELAGRVTDAAGAGMAGALVFVDGVEAQRTDPEELRRLGPRSDERPVHATWTGEDGRFSLPGASAGPARLWAHAEGFAFAWSEPLEVRPDGNAPVELVLHPLAADDVIHGIVLAPDDEPVPHAQLGIVFAQGNSQTSTSSAADEDGRFSLTVTARVPHTLIVSDQKERWASVPLGAVEPGGPELVVRFRETPRLRFEVVGTAGDPVESFELELMDARGFDRLGGVFQGKHRGGTVELPAPSVAFTVEVKAPGFERATLGPFPAEAELPTTRVVLEPLPGVSGRVLSGGEPVAGASVYLASVLSDDSLHFKDGLRCRYRSSRHAAAARSDADGRFRVFPEAAGPHVLRAETEGRAPAELELELDPARGVDGLELVLGAGGAIEGRVLVADGMEAEGRIIALNHGDGRGRTLRAGPEGRYRVEGLALGGWQVLAVDEEILPNRSTSSMGPSPDPKPIEWSCEVREGETTRFDVDLRARAGGRLLGRLALGIGAEGWTAALRRAEPVGQGSEVAVAALAADGAFELLYPEAGSYRLLVLSPPGAARLELHAAVELEPVEAHWEQELALGSIAGSIATPAPSAVHQYRFTGPAAAGDAALEINARFEPGAGGAFHLPFVPAGQGVLESLGSGESQTLRQVTVKAGQELAVELP